MTKMTKRTRDKHIRDRQRRDRKRRPRKTMRKKTMHKKTSAKQMRLQKRLRSTNKKIKRSVRIHRTRKMNGGSCCACKPSSEKKVIPYRPPPHVPKKVVCNKCLPKENYKVNPTFNRRLLSFSPCVKCKNFMGIQEGTVVRVDEHGNIVEYIN